MNLIDEIPTVNQVIALGGTVVAITLAGYRCIVRIAEGVCEKAMEPLEAGLTALRIDVAIGKDRFDTMWRGVMLRAEVSAEMSGMGVRNSPMIVNDEHKAWMAPLAEDLRAAYQAEWSDLDDDELALAIEGRFGLRIVNEVCRPRGITNWTCLVLACAVAKEK
jgi:hypothetical protein